MYILNAFVSIPELANNRLNTIAKFGELSVPAKTYTKEIRNYSDKTSYPGIELVTFTQIDGNANVVSNPDARISTQALQVAYYLFSQYQTNKIPLPTAKQTLINAVGKEFTSIRNILIGEIQDGETTGKRLVDYIRYDYVVNNQEWRCTLWFSDQAFRSQYPLYEIAVVPPIGDVLRLNATPAIVVEAVNSVNVDYVVNRIADITREFKATTYHVYTTTWHDPEGGDARIPVKWTVVIYGRAGVDQDTIKDAIREYLAVHGAGVDWTKIFPDLYAEEEFLIIPYWDQLSTATDGYDDGLYSSIIPLKVIEATNKRVIPNSYGQFEKREQHLKENFQVLSTVYRGIVVGVIGNPNNRGQDYVFSEKFPDYMAVATDRSDFSRMKDKTQRWILRLLEVLEMARDYNSTVELPLEYVRVVKASREYIGFTFDGYTYYVLTRMGYNKNL